MSQAFDKNVGTTSENVEHIRSIISNNKMCMLTSTDPDTGKLHSRPMYTVFNDADFLQNRTLYFFTHKSSHKMKETGQSRDINLSFSSPNDKTWLSLTGFGQIILDRSKMQQLWTSSLKPWFSQGLEDPDLALIQVQVDSAEYWDSLSSMKSLMSKAKSKITGEVPRDSATHKSVNLGAGMGTGLGAGMGSSGFQQQGSSFQSQGIQGQQFGSSSGFSSGKSGSHLGSDPQLSQKPFAGGAHPGVVEGVVSGTPSQGLAQGLGAGKNLPGTQQGQGPNWQGASADRSLDWSTSQQRRI